MNLSTEIFGEVVVAHAPEDLGNDHADSIEAFLKNLERVRVVVDLDGTESIDSRGLTALVNAQDALREQSGDLKIVTTNVTNRKIFEITRLDQQLEIFDSVMDAARSFA